MERERAEGRRGLEFGEGEVARLGDTWRLCRSWKIGINLSALTAYSY